MSHLYTTAIVTFLFLVTSNAAVERRWAADEKLSSWKSDLDGCYHVYIDVGSHRGIQVRKLYEPKKYPDSKVHPLFDKFFGLPAERNSSEICTVGFEPDPRYRMDLRLIKSNYGKMGWPIKFFFSAVSDYKGKEKVALRTSGKTLEEWKSTINPNYLMNEDEVREYDVNVVHLADYINTHVAKRLLPRAIVFDMPPRAIMKINIEGSEGVVVHDLLETKAMLKVSALYIQWYDKNVIAKHRLPIEQARDELAIFRTNNKDRRIQNLNDAQYSFSNMAFPKPPQSKYSDNEAST